jgi:hypothetical protein
MKNVGHKLSPDVCRFALIEKHHFAANALQIAGNQWTVCTERGVRISNALSPFVDLFLATRYRIGCSLVNAKRAVEKAQLFLAWSFSGTIYKATNWQIKVT